MLDQGSGLSVSVLSFVTTLHLAIYVVRRYRTPEGLIRWTLAPCNVFCATPWLFPSTAGVAASLAVHACWFGICESLVHVRRASGGTDGAASSAPDRRVRVPDAIARGAAQPKGFVPLQVLAAFSETPTIRTFRLRRPGGMTFLPGQFLALRIRVAGQAYVRCYSISSAPESTGYVDISVKRQGLVSEALHVALRPGSQVEAKPPAGKFVYPAADRRPIVLIAGGVGITPLMSMLRHAVAVDPDRAVVLLYSARGDDEFAYADELDVLGRRHPQIQVVLTSTIASRRAEVRSGRIDGSLIRACVPNPSASAFHMCGPESMIRDVGEALCGMGVPASQVRSEVFQQTKAIGASAAAVDVGVARAVSGRPKHHMTLVRSERRAEIDEDQPLLAAAEAVGVTIPSLCRAGVCGTCRVRVLRGDVCCTSDTLDADERAEGWVLPCVTWAAGDCALDA